MGSSGEFMALDSTLLQIHRGKGSQSQTHLLLPFLVYVYYESVTCNLVRLSMVSVFLLLCCLAASCCVPSLYTCVGLKMAGSLQLS